MTKICVLCNKSLKTSKRTNVGAEGLQTLIEISHKNKDNLHEIFSSVEYIQLHLVCRNKYTLEDAIINKKLIEDGEVSEDIQVEAMEVDGEKEDNFEVMEVAEDEVMSRNAILNQAFEQTCLIMKNSNKSHYEIQELVMKMKSFIPPTMDPYSTKYFVQKIAQKFGDEIFMIKEKGTEHFVCFKDQIGKLISSKFLMVNSEDNILETASEIIKEDVSSYVISTDEYPSFEEISSGGEGSIAQKFHRFMDKVLLPKKPLQIHKKKSLAIQNSMMSLMRPRYVSPLLIGIGTLIHRRTNSRYILDILNALNFCSSYSEILKMQKCAAVEPQRKKMENAYIQHSWDNADINTRTLNGHGTWHSMGGLECVTPANCAIVTSNLTRQKPDFSAKELGQFGVLPIKTYLKPKASGLKHMKIESVELTEDTETSRFYASTECLWLCGRLFDFFFQPSWFGYNAHITKEISGFAQTKTTPLPFINLDPGNLSTIYTALCFTTAQGRQLNQKIMFVTFDQPLYIKAVTMVKSANSSSEISKLVIRLGGFHLLMSFLGTIGYIMNGSGIEELYAQVYAKNTVVHMLSGHAYSRAVRACLMAQEAISHLLLENELSFTETDKSHLQSIFETYDVSIDKELKEPLLEKIESTLNAQFEKLQNRSRTSKLWILYWKMVQIAKNFIKAERSGDWNMHLLCVKKMLPYFHAAGRLQYAKCAQIYLQDMANLKNIMSPEEYDKFVVKSYFTIRRTGNFFTGTSTDMVIEQDLMRALKVSGGLNHGRGTTDNSLAVWMGALPYCSEIINSIEKFCGKSFTTSEQHVELRTSREKMDRDDFNKFKQWLKEHNPFDQTKSELYSISTGVVAASGIDCDRSEEIGATILKNIIGQNFEDVELNYKLKIKPLGFSAKAIKLNGQDVIINPHQLFHRILTIMPPVEKLKESFDFELSSYPLSIFDENGMRKCETASMFKHFDKIQGHCKIEFTKENSIFIISGELLLSKVSWNTTQTFGEVIDEYVNYVLHYYGRTNVMIVFGGPKDQLCQSNIVASRIVHFQTHLKVSVKQCEFLSNENNKLKLVDYIMNRLNDERIRTYQAEDNSDRLIAKFAVSVAHECGENIVVVADDLDILMLLIDQFEQDTAHNLFMLRPGKKMDNISDVASIQEYLGRTKEVILAAHSFSGTKTTSGFYKKGKITFLKKIMANDDMFNCLRIFNVPGSEVGDLCIEGEKLLLSVYGATKETTSINSYRYELFNKVNRKKKLNQEFNLATLPPTMASLQQHIMRTYFQVQQWKYNVLNPIYWGWAAQDGKLYTVRCSNTKVAPDWLIETIFCNCKTGCKTNCSCKNFKMPCSEACGFCRSECSNRVNFDLPNDD